MKNTLAIFSSLLLFVFTACKENPNKTTPAGTDSDSADVAKGWKLGIQMWTFHQSPFYTAIEKADSAGIKYVEAFPGQQLQEGSEATFDVNMPDSSRARVKDLLSKKGMRLVAFGVVVPASPAEWKKLFDFAADMGIQYITAEPLKQHWDTVNTMAGEYKIMVAIHDHPVPSAYSHPDSVMAAINGRINLGACADVGHWARNGLDIVQSLKMLEGRVIGVHLKDIISFGKVDARDTVLGKGVIPFPEVFGELKRQGFNGVFSIEHESNWQNNVPDVKHNKQFFEEQILKL